MRMKDENIHNTTPGICSSEFSPSTNRSIISRDRLKRFIVSLKFQ